MPRLKTVSDSRLKMTHLAFKCKMNNLLLKCQSLLVLSSAILLFSLFACVWSAVFRLGAYVINPPLLNTVESNSIDILEETVEMIRMIQLYTTPFFGTIFFVELFHCLSLFYKDCDEIWELSRLINRTLAATSTLSFILFIAVILGIHSVDPGKLIHLAELNGIILMFILLVLIYLQLSNCTEIFNEKLLSFGKSARCEPPNNLCLSLNFLHIGFVVLFEGPFLFRTDFNLGVQFNDCEGICPRISLSDLYMDTFLIIFATDVICSVVHGTFVGSTTVLTKMMLILRAVHFGGFATILILLHFDVVTNNVAISDSTLFWIVVVIAHHFLVLILTKFCQCWKHYTMKPVTADSSVNDTAETVVNSVSLVIDDPSGDKANLMDEKSTNSATEAVKLLTAKHNISSVDVIRYYAFEEITKFLFDRFALKKPEGYQGADLADVFSSILRAPRVLALIGFNLALLLVLFPRLNSHIHLILLGRAGVTVVVDLATYSVAIYQMLKILFFIMENSADTLSPVILLLLRLKEGSLAVFGCCGAGWIISFLVCETSHTIILDLIFITALLTIVGVAYEIFVFYMIISPPRQAFRVAMLTVFSKRNSLQLSAVL